MNDCKCQIDWNETEGYHIIYCPIHRAAPKLLGALKDIIDLEMQIFGTDGDVTRIARATIEAAEGRE